MITLELLGLDHSSLCSQLRECNGSRQKEMKKNETNVTGEKLLKPGIKELELTESRWRKMHQQMRKEINKDEYFVNCLLADCHSPMWQD